MLTSLLCRLLQPVWPGVYVLEAKVGTIGGFAMDVRLSRAGELGGKDEVLVKGQLTPEIDIQSLNRERTVSVCGPFRLPQSRSPVPCTIECELHSDSTLSGLTIWSLRLRKLRAGHAA